MKISELKPKQGNVEVIGTITEKGETRTFEKFGKPGKVCSAKLKDDSGECTLSLWNDQADEFNVGEKVHIQNGYAGEWQGEIQLSTGKFGKLEKLEGDEGEHILTNDEKTEEEILDESKQSPLEPTDDEIDVSEEDIE